MLVHLHIDSGLFVVVRGCVHSPSYAEEPLLEPQLNHPPKTVAYSENANVVT